jgi:hypothetical protein
MRNTSILKVAGQIQQENIKKLQRLSTADRYREALRQLKYKISNGKTLDEARAEMGLTNNKFWENLVSLLGLFTFNPHSVFIHYHVKSQTRYEQAMEIYNEAKVSGDLDLAAKMVGFMARLDEGALQVWERLRPLIPEPVKALIPKEEMTDEEKLERAYQMQRKADEIIMEVKCGKPPVTLEELVGLTSQLP